MNSKEDLEKEGFTGFKTIRTLMEDRQCIPKEKGVYAVLYIKNKVPTFISRGTGGFFKEKDPNDEIKKLQDKWIDNTHIIYIGKAGGSDQKATLYKRIEQYIKFGQGKKSPHWGGRYIWQLKDSDELIISWKVLPNDEPRDIESEMIQKFKKCHQNKLPFANMKNGKKQP